MSERHAGWIYVLSHPAWHSARYGAMVKIGKTRRDPRTRAREITSVSGLIAPCTIACCLPVSDLAAAETAVHRMLDDKRVRKRREMFRVDVATARQTIEAVARSQSSSTWTRASRRPIFRYRHRPIIPPRLLVAGLAAAGMVTFMVWSGAFR